MGKRSTNTTKSGKFMNPTDQARKEARRRELKKNKKQRLLVRQSVLKGKDPSTIFAELEKLDQMEFNPVQAAPLSEKVLKEKRKKLRDTLNRLMRMYEKEEPNEFGKVKLMEVAYEKKRAELIIFYESVKHTQTVNVEEIPLPNLEMGISSGSLPPPPPSILKKISNYGEIGKMFRKPPGVPSVPPPEICEIWDEGDGQSAEPGIPGIDDEEEDLPPYHTYYQFIRPPPVEDIDLPKEGEEDENSADIEEEEEDMDGDSSDEQSEAAKSAAPVPEPPRPTSLQARMLALAGQDVNTVIQEMDYLHRQKEINKQATFEARKARMESGEFDDEQPMDTGTYPLQMPHPPMFARPPMMPPYAMGAPPSSFGGYGPPLPGGPRLPPGPPPRMSQSMPPRLIRPPGMPPPPPPGIRSGAPPPPGTRPQTSSSSSSKPASSKPTAPVIEAKPQMRNLSAGLTKFVPTTLKVKKDVPIKKDPAKSSPPKIEWRLPQATPNPAPAAPQQQGPTKDDAYSQFMKELDGLM